MGSEVCYVAGYMDNLKLFGDTTNVTTFRSLNSNTLDGSIVKIDCTDNHCVILTENKSVYVNNDFAVLYSEMAVERGAVFSKLPLTNVIDIACGGSFVHFITDTYRIYVLGKGEPEKLGLNYLPPHMACVEVPQQFDDRRIVKISSTDHFTLYLDETRTKLFGSGDIFGSKLDQPIVEFLRENVKYMLEMNNVTIKQISSGSEHSLILFSNGQVMGLGKNTNGQLTAEHLEFITLPSPPRNVYAGSYHSFFIYDDQVLACGYGGDGRLGISAAADKVTPTRVDCFDKIQGSEIVDIIGRISTVFVVKHNGALHLYSCGRSVHGEGGYGDNPTEEETQAQCYKIRSQEVNQHLNNHSYTLKFACGYYTRFLYFVRNVHSIQIQNFYNKVHSALKNNTFSDIEFQFL